MSEYYIRDQRYTEEEIANISQEQYLLQNSQTLPLFFYKYFPNTVDNDNGRNYSIEALESNKVFLQNPKMFDDPFDSLVLIDETEYVTGVLKEFAKMCGVKVEECWDYSKTSYELGLKMYNDLKSGKTFEDLFEIRDDETELLKLNKQHFILSLQNELLKIDEPGKAHNVFEAFTQSEYKKLIKTFNSFRMSCFTLAPFSNLMWSHYANNHKGFCIEYETEKWSEDNKNIYSNFFPVIYSDIRTDLTDIYVESDSCGRITEENTWLMYKYGFLCKSLEWKYQQEWRLISFNQMITDKNNCCKFFKIKKVYLGNKMSSDERKKIIGICKNKGIPYTGVILHPNKFEMIECNQLCENCINLDSHTTDNEKMH